jgi:protein O-GlcNAc transferase
MESYEKALEIDPGFADAFCNKGSLLRDNGNIVEAIECYKLALMYKPDFPEAYANLVHAQVGVVT